MIINRTNLDNFFVGLSTAFNGALGQADTKWQRVATFVPSTTRENTYAWLGKVSSLREWLGDRVLDSVAADGYTIRNRKFEKTLQVPKDDIEDDQLGIYTPLSSELGMAAARLPEELVFGLLAAGFTTPCYDGQNFFDADHPVVQADGSTVSVSNVQAGAGAPWFLIDDSRVMKPIIYQERSPARLVAKMDPMTSDTVFMRDEFVYGADMRCNVGFAFWQFAFGSKAPLNKANFDAAFDAMTSQKGERGVPIGVRPRILVIPPQLRTQADEIVRVARLQSGADNPNFNLVEVVIADYLPV
ncbi:MAG: Mu-like prophage major head subunit gpT family protein [Rhizobiales bacterium]|nr:Mu-like prophage major head subunit gpT family protein [Hyphomicrobiales bacterium]